MCQDFGKQKITTAVNGNIRSQKKTSTTILVLLLLCLLKNEDVSESVALRASVEADLSRREKNKLKMAADVVCWNNLPSVILYEIFSYLTHKDKIVASSTCHNWRFALNHPSFWKNVHFKMKSSDENSVSRIQYLSSCSSRKLRNATVTFDSINVICVEQVAKVIENLLDNFNLKILYLKPSNCTIDCPGENELAKKMYFDRLV